MKAQPSSVKRVFESTKIDLGKSQDALTWIKGEFNKFQDEHIPTHIHAEAPRDCIVTKFTYQKTEGNPMIIPFGKYISFMN